MTMTVIWYDAVRNAVKSVMRIIGEKKKVKQNVESVFEDQGEKNKRK